MGISFLFSFAFHFFSQLFARPPRQSLCLLALLFLSLGFGHHLLYNVMNLCPVLQAVCVPDLIPWIYLSLPLYNCKGFDLGHTWWSSGFSYFLQFKSEFCNGTLWFESQSVLHLVFADYTVSPSLVAENIINLILVLTIWWAISCVDEECVCYDQCVHLAKLCLP